MQATRCKPTVKSVIEPWINMSQFNKSVAKVLLPGWSGGDLWEPRRVPIEFMVKLSPDMPRGMGEATSTLAWLKSADGNVILHVPAMYASSEDRAGGTRMTFKITRIDAAVYDVWVFRLHDLKRDPVTNQPRMRGFAFTGSPFRLRAQAAGGGRTGQRDAAAQRAGGEPRASLPQKRCQLGSPDIHGRWVRCSSVCAETCLRDGWVFVPWDCSHRIHEPAAAGAIARRMARERGRPLWLVMVGDSTHRGILHTLVDLLSLDTGLFDQSRKSVAGRGNVVKCWGWFDYLHGGLRMSYQDWRLINHLPRNDSKYRLRLAQLMREGADLILISSPTHVGTGQDWLLGFCREHAGLLRSWDGTLVLIPGIRTTAGPTLDFGLYVQEESSEVRYLRFATQLQELEDAVPGVRGKTLLWDLNPMLWSVVFDMEHPLESGKATNHWHRYGPGESHRMVHGMGAEMAAHVVLAALLERSSRSPYAQDSAAAAFAKASGSGGVACFACPEKACCPWIEPDPRPKYSLSSLPGELRLNSSPSMYSCSKMR